MTIRAIAFDKDGTLFDFGATWDGWAAGVIATLSDGDAALAQAMAASARYDLERLTFEPDSPVIAGTAREAAECFARVLPGRSVEQVERFLDAAARNAPLAPAVPLAPLLGALIARGLRLGVVTNDTETSARAHLAAVEVTGLFDFIAGFDSGYGMKPDPAPLLAFASAVEIPPEDVVMVGDSTHDLIAGRAAGMVTVGVLTGPARADALAPHADAVLADIGHLPDWLDGR
ncbi:HAD family hydrolase [Marinovum algicola]|jgi:phosphoglycolate phosphatase|uniref:HAD family hydrolase n=1 Tax=Marinovum algicola TaxID=42444 RepID=UPI0024BA9C98|nr:HAD family hydrolase [Marinovum algicola]